MARPRAEDRAAGTILFLALLLAAVLIGISLTTTLEDDVLLGEGQIDLGRGDGIRVLLTRLGAGPYELELPEGVELQTAEDRFQGRVQIEREGSHFLVDGLQIDSTLRTEGRQEFKINGESYRGHLSFDATKASGRPILSLPLEQYLAQVLPGEMPMSYPEEALAAQVIAARSFASWRMQSRRERAFDVSDSETSQMFEPLSQQTSRAKRLVSRSQGVILTDQGKILPAYYSANCGGETRSNAEAFGEANIASLGGRRCGYCQWSRHYQWTARLDVADILNWFNVEGPLQSVTVQDSEGSAYEHLLRLRGPGGSKNISCRELRRRSRGKLKSSLIVGAEVEGTKLVLSGRGFGHGVGLCQNGARGLALAGKKAPAILHYYYPGAKLQQLQSTGTP